MAGAAEGRERLARRAARLARALARLYPDADCALHHNDALQLLVATILSAQCTDERVNQVTPALFAAFPDAQAYAAADPPRIEAMIRSTGFFRNKARALQALGRALVEQHGGKVPATMDELVRLPGVGRKTANVLLGTWYGEPAITVDTHVTRLANRLGLTRHPSDAVKIEADLMRLLPRSTWTATSHALIWHGRRVCKARNPECERCALARDCPYPAASRRASR